MRKRIVPAKTPIWMVALLALAIAGCGGGQSSDQTDGTPQQGGTLRIAPEAEVLSFIPAKAIQRPEISILAQVLQGLFVYDSENEIKPLLVSKYEKSNDLRNWTFHLREGVKFSNGKPLTPADIAFTLEKAKESLIWGNLYEDIVSVTPRGPSTVEIKTKTPSPALPAVLALFPAGIIPEDFGGMSESEFGSQPIGTGPFEVTSWKRGLKITLERNPRYWKEGLPYLDSVVYTPAPNDSSRISQLKAGQIDLATKPPMAQLKQIESTPGIEAVLVEDVEMGTLLLNARKPLFEDPRAREAVNLALDRETIAEAAYKGYARPAASFFPGSMLYAKDIEPPTPDLAKAKKLLAEAVADTGEAPQFDLIVELGEEYANIAAQVIQENLKEAGFEITLKPLESSALYELSEAGEYGLCLQNFYSLLHDPVEQVAFYPATDGFWTGSDNVSEIARQAQEGEEEVDSAKRRQIYEDMQQEIYDNNNLVILYNAPVTWAAADDLSGFEPNSVGSYSLEEVGLSG